MREGVFHLQLSGDPYDGDAVHSPPLLLFIFDSLLRDTSATFIKGLYIGMYWKSDIETETVVSCGFVGRPCTLSNHEEVPESNLPRRHEGND